MKHISAVEVRAVLLQKVETQLRARGLKPEEVPDDFDLLTEGIIDSMGILELIGAVESYFGVHVDFEELDPEHLTIIGHLSRYFEKRSAVDGTGRA